MIANIDPMKSAITSILSAVIGSWYNYLNYTILNFSLSSANTAFQHLAWTVAIMILNFTLSSANTAFQHLAWTVAIIAGIVSIVNGMRTWKCKKTKNPKK